ncbi:hypothetical protein BD289DRAFT_447360 [Coniella lustricola]|uniref:Uncharacterized protein n=1 Tax=Coniella lustricola TaxID=2025994 RepID=A0A2T2ZT84_9PEZI|nr:hypothetical protein BD289DRAFT_447360 [Coniella lustricola]
MHKSKSRMPICRPAIPDPKANQPTFFPWAIPKIHCIRSTLNPQSPTTTKPKELVPSIVHHSSLAPHIATQQAPYKQCHSRQHFRNQVQTDTEPHGARDRVQVQVLAKVERRAAQYADAQHGRRDSDSHDKFPRQSLGRAFSVAAAAAAAAATAALTCR